MTAPYGYGMFSAAGNRAVEAMVNRLLKLPITTTAEELNRALEAGFNEVALKHSEVWDTDVRETVIWKLEKATGRELSIYF